MMAQLDTHASVALNELLENNSRAEIRDSTKESWANFVVSQLSRSPEDIRQIQENVKHYAAELLADIQINPEKYKNKIKEGDLEEFIAQRQTTFSDEKLAERVMPTILGHDAISNEIRTLQWSVVDVGKETFPLLTSDRPVSMTYRGPNSDIEITMPLSPKHLLIAATSARKLDQIRAKGKQKLVSISNLETTRKAVKYVYAQDDSMRDFVRKHISTTVSPSLVELVAKRRGFPTVRKQH